MGAGVFSSDFNGTGTTFLVSGELVDHEQDYRAYLKEEAENEGFVEVDGKWLAEDGQVYEGLDALARALERQDLHVMSMEQLMESRREDEISNLISSIAADAGKLGLTLGLRKGNRIDQSMCLDNDFAAIADDFLVEIGWRDWEHDFVVGVAAGGSVETALQDTEYHAADIIANYGMSPDRFQTLHMHLVNAVAEYIRLGLMDNGFDCRFRTSGYTTSGYEIPNPRELKDQRKQLEKTIKDTIGVFKSGKNNLLLMDGSLRAELLRELKRLHDDMEYGSQINFESTVAIPFFNPETNEAVWYSPYFEGAVAAAFLEPQMVAFMQDKINGNDMIAIPRTEESETWLAASQQHLLETRSAIRVVATAHEVVEAWKEDLVLNLPDENDDIQEVVVMRSNRPTMRM